MNMFSCVKPNNMVAQNNDLSSSSGHTSMEMQELMSIAMSLKKKCKSLRSLLLETENKRVEDQREYQRQYAELQNSYENKISEMNTQYMLEISQLKDYKVFEVDDLRKKLQQAQNELSMQGPLIITMTHKLAQYERQIDALSDQHNKDMENMHDAYQKHWASNEHAGNASAGKVSNANEHGFLTNIGDIANRSEVLLQRAITAETSLDQVELKYEVLLRSNHELSAQSEEYRGVIEQLRFQLDDVTQEKDYLENELLRASEDYDKLEMKSEEELKQCKAQVLELQGTVQDLLRSKSAVDEATKEVLKDNDELASIIEKLSRECDDIKRSTTMKRTSPQGQIKVSIH